MNDRSLNILLLCNGFKGTLTAAEANQAIEDGFRAEREGLEVRSFPMADGGQGSSEIASQLMGATRVECEVYGPDALPVQASYWLHKKEAFIELAEASGLVKSDLSKPLSQKTTYGTGQLIAHALENGAESISVFFGGSGTNDGGVGLAKALGVRFFEESGAELVGPMSPNGDYPGEQLAKIARYDLSELTMKKSTTLLGVVDVGNPLVGPNGSSMVYGLQKGGDPAELEELDRALDQLERLVDREKVPGLGAAGGSAFGLYAFCGAQIVPGPSYFLDLIDFDTQLDWADIVVTGEGKLDQQSLEGKLCAEMLARCCKKEKSLHVLAGLVELDAQAGEIDGLKAYGTDLVQKAPTHFETLRALARHVASELA